MMIVMRATVPPSDTIETIVKLNGHLRILVEVNRKSVVEVTSMVINHEVDSSSSKTVTDFQRYHKLPFSFLLQHYLHLR